MRSENSTWLVALIRCLIIFLISSVNADGNIARIKSHAFPPNPPSILSNKRPGNPIVVKEISHFSCMRRGDLSVAGPDMRRLLQIES